MMMLKLLALACALGLALAAAAPAAGSVVARHRTEGRPAPHAWEVLDRVPEGTELELTFALTNTGLDRLHRTVEEVSTPGSPMYGRYLSLAEVAEMTAPPAGALSAVRTYASGVLAATKVEVSLSRDFVTATVPVAALERALGDQGLEVRAFRHRRSGRVVHRAASPAPIRLPAELEQHLDIVTGLQDFAEFPSDRRGPSARRPAASGPYQDAPDFIRVAAGPSDFVATLLPYCKNGNTTSAAALCSDNGAAIESITLEVSPRDHPSFTKVLKVSDLTCAKLSPLSAALKCNTPVIDVPKYRRFNVTAQANFADGTSSAAWRYPTEASTASYVSPTTIFDLYNVPRGLRGTHPNNSVAVTAFEGQYVSIGEGDSDLARFYASVGQPYREPTVIGPNDPSQPGGEATLDLQYASIGQVPTTFWSFGGPGPTKGNGAYVLAWAKAVASVENPPLVTSISYGDTELGYYRKFGSFSYIERMNAEMAKMAARGLTVIAGSGDAGVSNVGEAGNDISATDPTCTPFRPFFPSNGPYTLSVGSTFVTTDALPVCRLEFNATRQPVVCEDLGEVVVSVRDGIYWTSGSGTSNLTMAPKWQQNAKAEFMQRYKADLPPVSNFNPAGRAYPDLVVAGHGLEIVWNRDYMPIDGTSASGPVLAALVSLVNDARLNAGKPPVGFLNPLLYKLYETTPAVFNDVTVGRTNDGDMQTRTLNGPNYATFCPYGFEARPGFDLASGLGSINWQQLRDAAMSL